MPELNFPPGYRFGEHNEYQVIRSQPISDGVSNTFAEVYLVKKIKVHKKFALKVLRPEIISKYKRSISDFENEIHALKSLTHKNIIAIDNFGKLQDKDGMPSFYLVMEYIEDASLVKEKYSISKMLRFFVQILDGLKFLHDNGIIHRDIKPDNILVQYDSLVKITDFGIAKYRDTVDLVSSVIGAPAYAPPEQITRSGVLSFSSDLYSAGKTLYTMITKLLPKPNQQITGLTKELENNEWSIPLSMILKKATESDPKDRYQSAEEMKGDIVKLYKRYFGKKRVVVLKETIKKRSLSFRIAAVLVIGAVLTIVSSQYFLGEKPSESADFLSALTKGELLFQSSDASSIEVYEYFENLNKTYTGNDRSLFLAAVAASENGKKEKSIDYLEKAVKLYPDNIDLKIAMGKAFHDYGAYFEAKNIWREAQRLHPDNQKLTPLLKLSMLVK